MAMSTIASTDILLMLRVRDGEAETFNVLVDRHRNDLIGFLYRMVFNHAIAEELAQDAFMRAYKSREAYQPTAKFTTWLYSIAMRLALNWIRDNRLRRSQPLEGRYRDGRPREFADSRPRADAMVLNEEIRRALRAAVAELPERQRAVLVMHRYQEMTYDQIAEALHSTPQAVKSMLFRAHASLRQRMVETLGSPN
jgi:RNA polymerase sigma-70 factor (ECF subfamily)